MSVLNQLSYSLNRRDEIPNQELAKDIVTNGDKKAIEELILNLKHKKKDIQNDCIKVLYEIGKLKPELIMGHLNVFLELLKSKNNRLQWGGMMALNSITTLKEQSIYEKLPLILDAVDKGSVITRDNAMNILITLCKSPKFSESTFTLFVEQFLKNPPNQLPMYAERALTIINNSNKKIFIDILNNRLIDIEKESKRKRIENVIHKLSK